MSSTRSTVIAGLGLLALRPAFAQAQWPTRPVRLVSTSPPAGASDILSRTLAHALHGQLGQSFVVENRPGGGGIIGADLVAKSAPDGYTWLTTAVASQAINATLMQQPFDPRKDFRHVTIIGRLPLVMLVNKDLPVQSLTDYVALDKSQPGKLNFGTGGVGTLHHLTGEVLKLAAARRRRRRICSAAASSRCSTACPRRCRICAPAPCARSRSAAPRAARPFRRLRPLASRAFRR